MKSNANKNKQEVRKLTPHDLAFGIGRKATEEELELLMEDMENEEFYSVDEVKKYIETNLKKQQQINKKNATTKV
ncbi:MAG: hypothetical protein IPK18_12995 [Sphingobacteriales bacterium]|jgi:2-succinyl-5-enolpyruvyl-6-hydroxy-3-cyclohexene-1-carboxylate synthase|nr:MAG: hypothetical protein IPK18_12995 [Sphingobacteriales bacterium]